VTPRPQTSLLGRHDIPPHGVREQIDYTAGAGPWGCDTAGPLGVTFSRIAPIVQFDTRAREVRHYRALGRRQDAPHVGEELAICFGGAELPIDVTETGPDGVRRHVRGAHGMVWPRVLPPSMPPGRYVVTATQAGHRVSGAYTLLPADEPAINLLSEGVKAGSAEVLFVGFAPRQRVALDIYDGVAGNERFVTQLTLRVSADGSAVYRIPTTSRDAGDYTLAVFAPHERLYAVLSVPY